MVLKFILELFICLFLFFEVNGKINNNSNYYINKRDGITKNTYYLYEDEDGTRLINNDSTIGYLFYNNNKNELKRITKIGYYVNDKNNAFYCNNRNDGKCEKTTVKESCTSGNNGNDSTIGKIFTDGDNLFICLNHNGEEAVSAKLQSGDNERYIVYYNNDNIFGLTSEKVALIKVNENSVVLSKSDLSRYVYIDKRNNKIITECPAEGEDFIEEFENQNIIISEEDDLDENIIDDSTSSSSDSDSSSSSSDSNSSI